VTGEPLPEEEVLLLRCGGERAVLAATAGGGDGFAPGPGEPLPDEDELLLESDEADDADFGVVAVIGLTGAALSTEGLDWAPNSVAKEDLAPFARASSDLLPLV